VTNLKLIGIVNCWGVQRDWALYHFSNALRMAGTGGVHIGASLCYCCEDVQQSILHFEWVHMTDWAICLQGE
jgi:hypothetical protein